MRLLKSADRVKLAEALYLLLEIVWISPKGAKLSKLYLNIGSIYLTFNHLDEAAKAYHNCLRLDPTNWKAQYNLGVALARLEDFSDATKYLRLAVPNSPADLVDSIHTMLHEIEEVQLARNMSAFKDIGKARGFTSQYLLTLRSVTAANARTVLPTGVSGSFVDVPGREVPPILIASSNGWDGAIASLLHRLFVTASMLNISIPDELASKDPSSHGVALDDLDNISRDITGAGLSSNERLELLSIFGERCAHSVTLRADEPINSHWNESCTVEPSDFTSCLRIQKHSRPSTKCSAWEYSTRHWTGDSIVVGCSSVRIRGDTGS